MADATAAPDPDEIPEDLESVEEQFMREICALFRGFAYRWKDEKALEKFWLCWARKLSHEQLDEVMQQYAFKWPDKSKTPDPGDFRKKVVRILRRDSVNQQFSRLGQGQATNPDELTDEQREQRKADAKQLLAELQADQEEPEGGEADPPAPRPIPIHCTHPDWDPSKVNQCPTCGIWSHQFYQGKEDGSLL